MAGTNVRIGKDHTIFAMKDGIVKFTTARKGNFDGTTSRRSVANVK
jgi:ribosomal protein L27